MKSFMKLLIISPTGGLSGVDQTMRELCIKIAKNKHEIVVVLPEQAKILSALQKKNIRVFTTSLLRWWFYPEFSDKDLSITQKQGQSFIHYLTHLIQSLDIDAVISNTSVFLDGLLAARFCGKPHITHLHALFVENIYTKMTEELKTIIYQLMGGDSFIVTPSEYIRSELITKYLLSESAIKTIPNGINCNKFIPSKKKTFGHTVIILSCGNKNDNKNLHFLVDVALALKNKNVMNFHFKLVGAPDPCYLNLLIKKIAEHKLESHFSLIDEVNNVMPYLHTSDIYVNTSITETFAISMLEAMSCALPLVCTPTSSAHSLIENKISGYIAESATEFAEIINQLIRSSSLRTKIGENARDRIRTEFTNELFTERFISFIKQSIAIYQNRYKTYSTELQSEIIK